MPIRVRCTECDSEYNLADKLAGKKIRCKKCENIIAVPAEEIMDVTEAADDAATAARKAAVSKSKAPAVAVADEEDEPRRKRRHADEDDEESPKRKSKSGKKKLPLAWIIGGSVAAVLLIVGVILAIVLTRSKKVDAIAVTADQINKEFKSDRTGADKKYKDKVIEVEGVLYSPPAVDDARQPFILLKDASDKSPVPPLVRFVFEAAGKDKVMALKQGQKVKARGAFFDFLVFPTATKSELVDVDSVGGSDKGTKDDKGRKDDKGPSPGPTDPPLSPWTVRSDSGLTLPIPEKVTGNIALVPNALVVFPSTPSPYVLLHRIHPGTGARHLHVFDLRTRLPKGFGSTEIQGAVSPYRLSPDGEFLCYVENGTRDVKVRSMATGKDIGKGPREPFGKGFGFIDFRADGHLLTGQANNDETVFTVNDPKTDTSRLFSHPISANPARLTLSPNRRYLAGINAKAGRLVVIGLSDEKIHGEAPFSEIRGTGWVHAMAFSPDGKFLSAVHGMPKRYINTWDMQTGSLVSKYELPAVLPQNQQPQVLQNTRWPLQWLPDNAGWLIDEHLLVDAQTGQVTGQLPKLQDYSPVSRRVLGGGYYVDDRVGGLNKAGLIKFELLPKK
jgi:hypothetical protein